MAMAQAARATLDFLTKRGSMSGSPDAGEVSDENESNESTAASSILSPMKLRDAAEEDGCDSVPVSVVVRCRPASDKQQALIDFQTENVGNQVSLKIQDIEMRQSQASSRSYRCNAYLGPDSTQEEVFQQAIPMIDHVMAGYNAAVLCYGTTGSGKSYTLSGPSGRAIFPSSPEAGIAQRTSAKIFEYIRSKSVEGKTFSVKASFLEIYTHDGKQEQLIDHLTSDDKKLEVKRDPFNPESFLCDGLTSQPIQSQHDLCDLLNRGRQRCVDMQSNKSIASSRSHCIFMLTVESFVDSDPIVKRGKLMLVDLAGSESFKKVSPTEGGNETLRRQQVIGINRVLSSLCTVANNKNTGMKGGQHDSMLTMLVQDCLGGDARALLVANIAPERSNSEDVIKTLAFAQRMAFFFLVHATVNKISQDQDSMVQRQAEQERLKKDVEEIDQRLRSKESDDKNLEDLHRDHHQRIEGMQAQMAEVVNKQLARLRRNSQGEMEELRRSISEHVTSLGTARMQKQSEEQEAQLNKISAEHEDTRRLHRMAEQEANLLKVKVASAEERVNMLQARLEEVQKERTGSDEETRSVRQQLEQLWQRLATAESNLHKSKIENTSQAANIERIVAARRDDEEAVQAAKEERDAAQAREQELQRKNNELRKQISAVTTETELATLKLEAEKKESVEKLQRQIEKLTNKAEVRKAQLKELQKTEFAFKAEIKHAQAKREDDMMRLTEKLKRVHKSLDESNEEKNELLKMIDDMHGSMRSRRSSGSFVVS